MLVKILGLALWKALGSEPAFRGAGQGFEPSWALLGQLLPATATHT